MEYKIAIVDDNLDDIYAIKRMLQKSSLKYSLLEFTNPIAALEELKQCLVDCIVLDYNFPEMTGLEFINIFHSQQIDIPIILLTGQGNEKIAVEVLKNGAFDYIIKNELNPELLRKSILMGIEKRDYERSEKTHNEFIKTLVDVTPLPLFYKNKNGVYLGCNKAFENFVGKNREEIIGKTAYEVSQKNNAEKYTDMDQELFNHPGSQTYEYEFVNSENKKRYVVFNKVTYKNALHEVEGLIGIITDITEAKLREKELAEKSFMDSLTEIANRRYFDEHIESIWAQCQKDHEPLALVMVDIDLFKNYNDFYGHQEGDVCLKKVASGIKNALHRFPDIPTRYGGEEFTVILPYTNSDGAYEVAERIRQNILNMGIKHEDSTVAKCVTVSQGIAEMRGSSDSIYACLMQADQALYLAKENGRNRIEKYHSSDAW